MNTKKAQVWVETVIYTLIGLAIITALLAIAVPIIKEKQDQLIVQQSIDVLNNIDSKIEEVAYYGAGNSRSILVSFQKGQLIFNAAEDYVRFSIDSNYKYSEPNVTINSGRVSILTTKKRDGYQINLTVDYSPDTDLQWEGTQDEKVLNTAPTPYNIIVTNAASQNKLIINITQV